MMQKKITDSIRYLVVLGGLFIGIIACSSRDNGEAITDPKETSLIVNVSGISDYAITDPIASVSQNLSLNQKESSVIAKEKMVYLNDFDALVSVEKLPSSGGNAITESAVASGSSKALNLMAATGMASGVQYRLMIYDAADTNNTGSPAANVVLTSGSAPSAPIKIDAGKTYNWYAYSTNESTVPAVGSNGVVDKAGLMNKDVLWAKGTFSAQYGNNNLSITFRRNTTLVNVEINSLGMFGVINGNVNLNLQAGTNGILKYGDLNVFDGGYANPTVYSASNVAYSNSASTTNTYRLYTIDNTTNVVSNNLKLQLGGFEIIRRDYNTINNQNNNNNNSIINYTAATASINNTAAFTFVQGSSYKVTLKLIESAVSIGSVKWARSNLKAFDGRLGGGSGYANGPFFMADPMNNLDAASGIGGAGNGNFYWDSSKMNNDLCAQVFPAGTWRLPTSAEFSKLSASNATAANITIDRVFAPNTLSGVNPAGRGNGYFGINYQDPSVQVNNNYPQHARILTFPMAGYNDNGLTSGYNITQNVSKGPMETAYWIKDGTVLKRAVFNTNGNYTYNGSGNGPAIFWGGIQDPIPGQTLSIRCVRQ